MILYYKCNYLEPYEDYKGKQLIPVAMLVTGNLVYTTNLTTKNTTVTLNESIPSIADELGEGEYEQLLLKHKVL